MKIFKVKVPPFPGFITIISGSLDELMYELEKRNFTTPNNVITVGDHAVTLKTETAKGTAVAILLLPEIDDLTLWHECLHAAWYALDVFGVKIDVDNHEVLAYQQGYLFEQIKKRL